MSPGTARPTTSTPHPNPTLAQSTACSSIIGITTRVVIHETWIGAPVGMSLALVAMQLTRTTHPPGGRGVLGAGGRVGCRDREGKEGRGRPAVLGRAVGRAGWPAVGATRKGGDPACLLYSWAMRGRPSKGKLRAELPRGTGSSCRCACCGRLFRPAARVVCCRRRDSVDRGDAAGVAQVARLFIHRHHRAWHCGHADHW